MITISSTPRLTIVRTNGMDGTGSEIVSTLITDGVTKPYAIPSVTSRLYAYHEASGLTALGNPKPTYIYADTPTQTIKGIEVEMPNYFSNDADLVLKSVSIATGLITTTGYNSSRSSVYDGPLPKKLFISGNVYVAQLEDGSIYVDGNLDSQHTNAIQLTSGRIILSGPSHTAVIFNGAVEFNTEVEVGLSEGFGFRAVIQSNGQTVDYFFHRGSIYKITPSGFILLHQAVPDDSYTLTALPICENNYVKGQSKPYVLVKGTNHYYSMYFNQETEQASPVFQINPNSYINMNSNFATLSSGLWAFAYDNLHQYVNQASYTDIGGGLYGFSSVEDGKANMDDRIAGTSDSQKFFFGTDVNNTAKLFYIKDGLFHIDTFQFGDIETPPSLVGANSNNTAPFSMTGLTIVDHVSYKFPYLTNSGYTQANVAFFRLSNGSIVGIAGENTDRYFYLPKHVSLPAVVNVLGTFRFVYYDAYLNSLVLPEEVFAT